MPRSPKHRPKSAPAKASPASGHLPRERLTEVFVSFALAVATILVYCPAFDHPFVNFDDEPYVTHNTHVQAGLNAAGIRWAFSSFAAGNWHPLTWLSLELDSTLFGGTNAGGFHLTSVLLHTASTVLLFLVLARMTGRVGPSAFVAALFALHPLNVEPVAWVAERKGVLSAFFWMLTLAAYLYYVRRPSVRRYLPVLLTLVLGLMAKPTAMTLPAVLLLLDYWPLGRWTRATTRRLLLEKAPLFAVVMGWLVLAYLAQSGANALPSFEAYPFSVRVWNGLLSYVAYLGKMFWPTHLALPYPHPGASVSIPGALVAGVLLALIIAFVAGPGRRWPYLLVGWFWFLGTLVPMIGLVQIGDQGMADRYTYVPMIGVFLLLTWAAADLAKAWNLPRLCLPAAAAVVLLVCTSLTWTQLGYWRSDFDLWTHALAVTKNNAMAHSNLGKAFHQHGLLDRAEKEFATAVKIDPEVVLFHHNLATALRDLGRGDDAIAEFRKVIAMTPREPADRFILANLLRDLGRRDEALKEYDEALELDPDHPVLHNERAGLLRDLGRREEALIEYRKASDLDAAYAPPHAGLGNVLHDLGRRGEAIDEYRQAITLSPDNGVYHNNLALALQADGRLDEAVREFGKALDLGYALAGPRLQTCELLRQIRGRLPLVLPLL